MAAWMALVARTCLRMARLAAGNALMVPMYLTWSFRAAPGEEHLDRARARYCCVAWKLKVSRLDSV